MSNYRKYITYTFHCRVANNIWTEFITWLNRILNAVIYLDIPSLILGKERNEMIVNTLFFLTEHDIFKCKCKGRTLNLNHLKCIFDEHMKTDIYQGAIKNKLHKALGKWAQLHNEVSRI